MTRDEIAKLSLGSRLQLTTGDVVEVKSNNTQDEKVTFQYVGPPKRKRIRGANDGFAFTKNRGQSRNANAEIEAEAEEKGKTPTVVKCGWIELHSAILL